MLITGFLLAISILLLLYKLPRVHKTALDHPAMSDISITLGVIVLGLFTATFSGMITGVIAGIFLSLYFTVRPKIKRPQRREKVINPNTRRRPHVQIPKIPLPERRKRFDELTIDELQAQLTPKTTPLTYEQALERAKKL